MQDVIAGLAEKTLVGCAFFYLLYFFVSKFSVTQEKISETLNRVCDALTTMNMRLEQLEKRIEYLEDRK